MFTMKITKTNEKFAGEKESNRRIFTKEINRSLGKENYRIFAKKTRGIYKFYKLNKFILSQFVQIASSCLPFIIWIK